MIAELGNLLEISERKADILTNLLKEANAEYEQTLEKIRVSETNFRAIFENAPEAIYIVELSTRRILDCNPFMVNWLGYAREELLAMQAEDILEPRARKQVQENIEKTFNDGLFHIQSREYVKQDGSVVEAEVTGTLLDFQGKKSAAVLVRDMTQRRQIEALGRYKVLFENVSDPVFINDGSGIFLEVNDVACVLFGYPREQLLTMTLRELTAPEHLDVLDRIRGRRIDPGQTVQFELNLMTRGGETIPFELQGKLIRHMDRPAFLSVARNLSIRKNLQETLIRAERLTAVGEMASGVAHNFNNLLQMIIAGAEVASAKLDNGKIRDCGEAIKNIISASRRGADVVRRIKDFTQVDGNVAGTGRVFDLDKLVTEASELTRPLWKPPSNPGKYRFNLVRGGGCHIKGISSEIYEVLVNLIKNALEAMASGGTLIISTRTLGNTVLLKVTDTGGGIPEDLHLRIFEPFFTTKGTQSSGLGLSSCYGIVKKFQGNIQVQSRPGQGTEFTVTFPLARPGGRVETAAAPPQARIPIRFLLIDDEVNILKSMEMYFEDSEVSLTTAGSGADGVKRVKEDHFDVILCDYGMDDMNGLDVGREIRAHYEAGNLSKPPFLLYTGLDRQLDAEKLDASGVHRVVSKPTSCQDLLTIIRQVVAARQPMGG